MAEAKRARGGDPIGYMSLGKAAKTLGMPGKHAVTRLRRILLAKERDHGKRIMLRSAGPKRPKIIVTIPMLRQWCPELFSARDELVAMVREEMGELREQVEELVERDAMLAAEQGQLSRRVAEVEKRSGMKNIGPGNDRIRHATANG